jgi:hypothetical protein
VLREQAQELGLGFRRQFMRRLSHGNGEQKCGTTGKPGEFVPEQGLS